MDQLSKRSPTKDQRDKPKIIQSFNQFMKDFPPGLPQQIITLLNKNIPNLNQDFITNLDTVKIYRPALGTSIQSNWIDLMNFLKKTIIQINVIVRKVKQDCDGKVDALVRASIKSQKQNADLRDRLQRLQTLRSLQIGELDSADLQTQALKKQISSVYQILQKDMKKIIDYLGVIEKSDDSDSNSIYNGLEKLSNSLNLIQQQKVSTTGTLSTMNELIKAMVKNSKTDNCTQVQESELPWKATSLITSQKIKIQLDQIEKASINYQNQLQKTPKNNHLLTQLKIKQKQIPPDIYNPKKNVEKPWVLPPSILIFIQNMSKQNQNGRVLPWQHVKKIINQVLVQRLIQQKQIVGGLIGTVMPFDQFFVLFFVRKYNMRRLAELKMLQFIISLKYYVKFWQKAELFCYLLDIMRYQPTFQTNQTNTYKLDIYVQHYYFYVFSKLYSDDIKQLQQGNSYISFKRVKVMTKKILFFTDDFNRSRFFARLQKTVKQFQGKDYVDFDSVLLYTVDQFLNVRKKNTTVISKNFSKVSESIHGYFSLKQIHSLFNQFDYLIKQGQGFGFRYPVQSKLQLSKLYLYSITSSKNGFDINGKQFINACQKFGFDSPFPFLHVCSLPDIQFRDQQQKQLLMPTQRRIQLINGTQQKNAPERLNHILSKEQSQTNEKLVKQSEVVIQKIQKKQSVKESLLNQKIEIGSILFSQHFSILRQLRQYCIIFKETLSSEKDGQKLWNEFGRILQVLEKGCKFLKLPLKT